MVSSNKSPAFTAAVQSALLSIQEIGSALEAHVGLPDGSLQVPSDLLEQSDPHHAKKFCAGLLENPESHPWTGVLSRASLNSRTTVAGSLFLARKLLPVQAASWESHAARVTVPSPVDLPAGYLPFVRKVVGFQLPRGWDKHYERRVSSFSPPASATTSTPRSKGGARAEWLGKRSKFIEAALGVRDFNLPTQWNVNFMNVEVQGKSRSVTVASSVQQLLGPLHRCLYDTISQKDWLLRGAAKPGKFRSFEPKAGEVFVSGDYESATDNLPFEVAECILEVARDNSTVVPERIWELAFMSLRSAIKYPDGSVRAQVRGQLMGNLMCFPLLCLQNYVAFRWCFRGRDHPPVRINGDDIVFRAREDASRRWMNTVSRLGLKLSIGKTLVSKSVFSLNSTFFRATRSGIRSIPVCRSAVLSKPVDVPHSLGPGLSSFACGFKGEARVRLESVYLRYRGKSATACGRSLLRDLMMPLQPETLRREGLAVREAFYLSLDPLPLGVDYTRLGVSQLPAGFRRVFLAEGRAARRRQRLAQESFFSILTSASWNEAPSSKSLSKKVWKANTPGYLPCWRRWRKESRARGGIGHSRVLKGSQGKVQLAWCDPVVSARRNPTYRRFAARMRCPVTPVYDYSVPVRRQKVWSGGGGPPGLGFVQGN
nr:MAG: putative RNA-dependent RNA polymerase [Magoulivirus sp.]